MRETIENGEGSCSLGIDMKSEEMDGRSKTEWNEESHPAVEVLR
jgi:hypothetical protein